jgi:23S rRNA (uridine2552-2'-O)-methyltransferase
MSKDSFRNKNGKVTLKNRKQRTDSSRRWLLRQLNDPYVQQAQSLGYRSRAAFKILDIDQKFKLFKSGSIVVDLGAAPGGWTQVALRKVGDKGQVVAIDLQEIDPISGALILQGDFMDEEMIQQLLSSLPSKADVVLSDMAAPASGMTDVDHIRIMALVEMVFDFCFLALKPKGSMVAKVLRGGTETKLLQKFKKCFTKVVHFKPPSSRAGSAEMYLVATGFRPEKKEALSD